MRFMTFSMQVIQIFPSLRMQKSKIIAMDEVSRQHSFADILCRPKYYIPRNVYPTPHYYPQQPSPHLANPALLSKFDVDTLFYIFYYCQGTYMQYVLNFRNFLLIKCLYLIGTCFIGRYLAAQELKKQSWRFHKQYLTWFHRANEPQAITDTYEQGVYLYFDFEGSWAQRRKENFSFFYRYLEE